MQLQLIDDLPLFTAKARRPQIRRAVDEAMECATTRMPASLHYLPYAQLVRWWLNDVRVQAHRFVLVGARPALLNGISAVTTQNNAIRHVKVRREFDAAGRTVAANVDPAFDVAIAEWTATSATVCVIDDVMMSGHTIAAVVDRIRAAAPHLSITVRLFLATSVAYTELCSAQPKLTIEVGNWGNYRPINEGTAIFLMNLLYGTLRGKEFMEQKALLRPFFGDDLTPFHILRAAVESRRS